MANFLGTSSNDTRSRLRLLDDSVNSTRINGSGNGTQIRRGSGGTAVFTPKTSIIVLTQKPFQVYDASSGATPQIGVIPSTLTDQTNSGMVWTPTLNGTAINVIPPPVSAAVNASATVAYLKATVASTTGFITALEIDTDTGGGVPASTSTISYILLSHITVTVSGGVASIAVSNDGWFGPLVWAICGGVPLTTGTQYRWGT